MDFRQYRYKIHLMKLTIGIIFLLSLTFGGCGGGDSNTGSEDVALRFATVRGGGGDSRPKVVPTHRPPPKEVAVKVLKPGSGPLARRGDRVTVYYVGFDHETGEEQYDGRWPPAAPQVFELGHAGQGVGWEEAIEGMQVGERREAIVPSRLLHGTGAVDYVIDLVRIQSASRKARERRSHADESASQSDERENFSFEQEGPFSAITGGNGDHRPKFDPPDRLSPKVLRTRDLVVGTGRAARRGDEVGVYYAGAIYKTGRSRYEGWPPASSPVTFQLGFGLYEDAWERGIEGMRVGGSREMIVPARLLAGSPTLDYVIKLVTLEPGSGTP